MLWVPWKFPGPLVILVHLVDDVIICCNWPFIGNSRLLDDLADIVIVYVQRYTWGHEKHFVPPITGIHLAALCLAHHEVRVVHQQVEAVDLDTDADNCGECGSPCPDQEVCAAGACVEGRHDWQNSR